MKRKMIVAFLLAALCMLLAIPAMAADVFRFDQDQITVFAGESVTPELRRDGKFAEGEVVYSAKNDNAEVDGNGVVTGVKPGQVYVDAELKADGKTVRRTRITVNVLRKVESVTVDTSKLQVYDAGDPVVSGLLKQDPDAPVTDPVLVMAANSYFYPQLTFTPKDIRSWDKRITVISSDTNVVKFVDGRITAVHAGECDIRVQSIQNPEAEQRFHVLVTQPVKKITVTMEGKSVAAGSSAQLTATVSPEDATIKNVTWSSKNEKVATVDANGIVTGLARGNAVIEARATDGSGRAGSLNVSVIQGVTGLTIRETEVTVATGRHAPQLHVTVAPENASSKSLTWTSSDESIATVRNGSISGKKAGECVITCASVSNPEITASIPVHVVQLANTIVYTTPAGLSFYIGESRQLTWQVLPEDTTNKDVTFRSRNLKAAVVDQNGIVTGVGKGAADIEVKANDGSGKYRVYRVNILKAVEGIEPLINPFYAQLHGTRNIRGTAYPKDASNLRILWSGDNDAVGTVKSAGTAYGHIYGRQRGTFNVTATTEDGGFSSTATVIVDDFNGMVMVNSVYIDENNKIRMTLWNMSRYYTVNQIYFRVDCYNAAGEPVVCNRDGESTYFNGYYPLAVGPGERTSHGRFIFTDYVEPEHFDYVTVTVTGFDFDNGQQWWIPESEQNHATSEISQG